MTRRIRTERSGFRGPVWQRGYWDHVVRDEEDYARICEYIETNPQRWIRMARISRRWPRRTLADRLDESPRPTRPSAFERVTIARDQRITQYALRITSHASRITSHLEVPVSEDSQRLTTRTKLVYGIGDVGNAMSNTAIQFFLLIFYTDAALIAPALAGARPGHRQAVGRGQRPPLRLDLPTAPPRAASANAGST